MDGSYTATRAPLKIPSGDRLPSVRLYRGLDGVIVHFVVCLRTSFWRSQAATCGTQLKSSRANTFVVRAGITVLRVSVLSIKYRVCEGSCALRGARRYSAPTVFSSAPAMLIESLTFMDR